MLKLGLKTINAELIRSRALSQLSFIQFRPYANSFPELLSLTLVSTSKMTLKTSLVLTPSFKTSIDAKVKGLVFNNDYLESQRRNFIQKNYGRKRRLPHTYEIFTALMTRKCKKINNEALSKQSKQFLLLFYFLV